VHEDSRAAAVRRRAALGYGGARFEHEHAVRGQREDFEGASGRAGHREGAALAGARPGSRGTAADGGHGAAPAARFLRAHGARRRARRGVGRLELQSASVQNTFSPKI
jgi:hypothetical protein